MIDPCPDVLTGERVTSFERVGRGPTILALTAGRERAEAWVAELSTAFRLVLPAVGPLVHGPDRRDLGEVVEALGLERPPVVADATMVGPLLQFALQDPWRLRAMALLFPVPVGRPPGVAVRTVLEPIGLPMLLLPVPSRPSARGALRPLFDFLGAVPGPAETPIDKGAGGERNFWSPSG